MTAREISANDFVSDTMAAAAYWHEIMEEGATPAERADFEAWLAGDASRREAYEQIAGAWDDAGRASESAEIIQMRREALAAAAPGGTRWRRGALAGLAAALAVAVFGGVALMTDRGQPVAVAANEPANQSYSTAIGERSTVTLPDGTTVSMNTDSRLEVDYLADMRGVRLLAGQALFEVAKDPSRPFVVSAGGQTVTAVGTAFDVRVKPEGDGVQVTLIEGVVDVAKASAPSSAAPSKGEPEAEPTRLAPGQQLVVAEATDALLRDADIDRVTSWREGRLIFEDEPLSDVLSEANRYSRTHIVLADGALADLRISGVFLAGRNETIAEAISTLYELDMRQDSEDRFVLDRKG